LETLRGVDEGLDESLLTDRLHQALDARTDLRADTGSVDDAEQPLTLARHLHALTRPNRELVVVYSKSLPEALRRK
jgi:hypothetical protein